MNNRLLPFLIPIVIFYSYWILEFLKVLPVIPLLLQLLGISSIFSLIYYFRKKLLDYFKIKPLLVGFVLYVEFTTLWMYLKHLSFQTFAFDLGIFTQSLYTTLYNHLLFAETPDIVLFTNSLTTFQYIPFFEIHFSPIMFLLLPFYASFPSEITLFLIQSIISASPIFLIYAIAREYYDYRNSIIISLSYLINPILYYANFFDFHVESFIPFFFFLLTYYFLKDRLKEFLVSLVFTFTIIEATPILYLFYIPYLYFLKKKNRKLLLSVTILLALGFYAMGLVVKGIFASAIPWLLPYNPQLDKTHIILNGVIGPFFIYLILFNIPVLLTPIFRILPSLPAFAWLFYGLLSLYYPYFSIYYQYNYIVLPFFYISFVEGYKVINIKNFNKVIAIALASLAVLFASQPIFNIPPSTFVPNIQKQDLILNNILVSISNSCIFTTNEIFPHVANNNCTFLIPSNLSSTYINPDYVILRNYDSIYYFYIINYYYNKNYSVVSMWFPNFIILSKEKGGNTLYYKPLNLTLYLTYESNKTGYAVNYFLILFPGKQYEISCGIAGTLKLFNYSGKEVFNASLNGNNVAIIEPKDVMNIYTILIEPYSNLTQSTITINIKEI